MPDVDFKQWAWKKLNQLAADFKAGNGDPMIFESQYLCYLECYVVACGVDTEQFWNRYLADCKKEEAPDSKVTLGHYFRIKDRGKLIERILQFREQFEGPKKQKRAARAQKKPVARSTPEDLSDLFDILGDIE